MPTPVLEWSWELNPYNSFTRSTMKMPSPSPRFPVQTPDLSMGTPTGGENRRRRNLWLVAGRTCRGPVTADQCCKVGNPPTKARPSHTRDVYRRGAVRQIRTYRTLRRFRIDDVVSDASKPPAGFANLCRRMSRYADAAPMIEMQVAVRGSCCGATQRGELLGGSVRNRGAPSQKPTPIQSVKKVWLIRLTLEITPR